MKKLSLLKTVLLLCALIVGSSNVWADSKVTLWSEDFSAYSANDVPSGTITLPHTGTSVYASGTLSYSCTNGNGTKPGDTKIYEENTGGGTSPELLVGKYGSSGSTGGSFTAVIPLNNIQGTLTLTWYQNKQKLHVYSTTTDVSGEYDAKPSDVGQQTLSFTGITTSMTSITIVFQAYSSNVRLDNIVLEGTPASSDPSSDVAFTTTNPSINFPGTTTYSQEPTTADGYMDETGAAISYEITANTAGASINASTGLVTVTQEGSVTVKATAAAVAGKFASSNASYTLTVTDTRSEAGLAYADDSQEVYVGDVLSAPTLTNPHSLDVTYSSDDVTIATVDASGNVTGVKKGSTTITATFDGNETYKPGSASYTINVAKAIPAGALFFESLSGYTSSSDGSTALTTSSTNLDSENWSSFSRVYPGKKLSGDTDGHLKFGSSDYAGTAVTKAIALTGNGKLTYKVQRYDSSNTGNLTITVTGATATGDVDVTGTAAWVEKNVFLTGATGSVVITFATTSSNKRIRVDDITVTEVTSIPVTISSASGFATLFTPYPLNFATLSSELKAYTATVSENTVTLTPVENVQANTGVVLKGDVKTHTVPVIASSSTAKGSLEGSATEAMAYDGKSGYDLYMLALDGEGKAQFTKVTSGSIAAGKAYLPIATGGEARVLNVVFDEGETTGISEATLLNNNEEIINNNFFDLQGRRVAQPTKGLYIVNGKKVVIK